MIEEVMTLILKEGNPTGIIEYKVDVSSGISYKIPRTRVKEASKLKCINYPGVYVLFGEDENTAEKVAYIGEADKFYKRLKEHNRDDEFWNECIVFMSENNSLNKAHIKRIEHEIHKIAMDANRLTILNGKIPQNPQLDDANTIIANKFIEKIKTITSIMGYRLFDKIIVEEDNILYLTNNSILYATGMLTDEGFVILKGSRLKEGISDGISKSLINFCERERKSLDIVDGEFVNDHLCTSPSMAGVIILGRNCNGYITWKNKNNILLKELINR